MRDDFSESVKQIYAFRVLLRADYCEIHQTGRAQFPGLGDSKIHLGLLGSKRYPRTTIPVKAINEHEDRRTNHVFSYPQIFGYL
jgi:hypothetical protein